MFWFPSIQRIYIMFILPSCTVHQLYESVAIRKLRRGAFQSALCNLWFCYVVERFWSDVTCSFPFQSSRLLLSVRKHFVLVNHCVSSQMRHIECPCVDLVVKHEDLSLLNGNQCLVCHGNLSLVRSASLWMTAMKSSVEETTAKFVFGGKTRHVQVFFFFFYPKLTCETF